MVALVPAVCSFWRGQAMAREAIIAIGFALLAVGIYEPLGFLGGPRSLGLKWRDYGLIKAIRIGQREALEFECDCEDHDDRRDQRAWFQIFGSYSDGVLLARCCGWTEGAGGWACPECSRKAAGRT